MASDCLLEVRRLGSLSAPDNRFCTTLITNWFCAALTSAFVAAASTISADAVALCPFVLAAVSSAVLMVLAAAGLLIRRRRMQSLLAVLPPNLLVQVEAEMLERSSVPWSRRK